MLVYSFPSFHVLSILNVWTIASITISMSFSPNYSIYWLQLVTVLFSKKHVFPSSLKVTLDTKTFLPGEQYFLHIFFIITLECSTFFRDLFLEIFCIFFFWFVVRTNLLHHGVKTFLKSPHCSGYCKVQMMKGKTIFKSLYQTSFLLVLWWLFCSVTGSFLIHMHGS